MFNMTVFKGFKGEGFNAFIKVISSPSGSAPDFQATETLQQPHTQMICFVFLARVV